jgi:guanylate kinase
MYMLIALVGPSGVGKGYLRKQILEAYPHLPELTWLTTRELRPDEMSKRSNRRSVSIEQFETLEQTDRLVLVQRIHGNAYAVQRSSLVEARCANVLTELHINNLLKVHELGIPVVALALIATSKVFLRSRLKFSRRTESDDEIAERVGSATREMAQIRAHKHLLESVMTVTEHNPDRAVQEAMSILQPFLEKQ